MNAINPATGEPNTWLGRTFGLRGSDETPFAGRVRIRMRDDHVFAHHYGDQFEDLGWECIYRDPDGRPATRYKRGARKGVVATPTPRRTRLIVTEGVLSALAAAALLPPDDRTTCVAAIGGAWNAYTASCVVSTYFRTAAISVEFAFSAHVPALRTMRDRAVDHLNGGGVDAIALDPPPGGWLAALREARSCAALR